MGLSCNCACKEDKLNDTDIGALLIMKPDSASQRESTQQEYEGEPVFTDENTKELFITGKLDINNLPNCPCDLIITKLSPFNWISDNEEPENPNRLFDILREINGMKY